MEKTIQITREENGRRLDVVLAARLKEFSRTRIRGLISEQCVTVEGRNVKASAKLKEGVIVKIAIPEKKLLMQTPVESIPLDILYEDRDVLVLNKPREMTVHPGAGRKRGTLVNALLYHCKDLSGIGGVLRPGIVHRLDRNTSGVMVVAKNDFAHQHLSDQFKQRKVKKKYLALVWGKMGEGREGELKGRIARARANRKKMTVVRNPERFRGASRDVETRFKVLQSFENCSLLEVMPVTGRTHQIRVQMADAGHPVVGDLVYGRKKAPVSGQFLHALELEFIHPRKVNRVAFVAPLPKELENLLKKIEMRGRLTE